MATTIKTRERSGSARNSAKSDLVSVGLRQEHHHYQHQQQQQQRREKQIQIQNQNKTNRHQQSSTRLHHHHQHDHHQRQSAPTTTATIIASYLNSNILLVNNQTTPTPTSSSSYKAPERSVKLEPFPSSSSKQQHQHQHLTFHSQQQQQQRKQHPQQPLLNRQQVCGRIIDRVHAPSSSSLSSASSSQSSILALETSLSTATTLPAFGLPQTCPSQRLVSELTASAAQENCYDRCCRFDCDCVCTFDCNVRAAQDNQRFAFEHCASIVSNKQVEQSYIRQVQLVTEQAKQKQKIRLNNSIKFAPLALPLIKQSQQQRKQEHQQQHRQEKEQHNSTETNQTKHLAMATVRPISPQYQHTLDSAIMLAKELASKNMADSGDSSPKTPNSPDKKRFNFKLKHFSKSYSEASANIRDIESSISEEAKRAYKSLVEGGPYHHSHHHQHSSHTFGGRGSHFSSGNGFQSQHSPHAHYENDDFLTPTITPTSSKFKYSRGGSGCSTFSVKKSFF